MFLSERIQNTIHQLDDGILSRAIKYLLVFVAAAMLMLLYDLREYHNFSAPEAMDGAQVARNLAEGNGFSTEYIRPFSLFLIQRHNHGMLASTNSATDFAEVYRPHPDLANAPVYPLLLAGMMKISAPEWKVEMHKSFWSEGGNFRRYKPEFAVAIFNQLLLFLVAWLTFLVARKLFDAQAAWLAAVLVFGSEILWQFSVSGLSTLLLMVFILGLVWCLLKIEEQARTELPEAPESPNARRLFILAGIAGLIIGLGMLTRYSFGWMIVPVAFFLALFGGSRRMGLVVAAGLVCVIVVSPWILRNVLVSGTPFGIAGFAMLENTDAFPGANLMQSTNPELSLNWVFPFFKKFVLNTRDIFQGTLPHVAGSWLSILFFAGLLLGLRNVAARRLRYFTLMCLGVFVLVQAAGATQLSEITPTFNSENLLIMFMPLAVIFAVGFFLTLVNQMELPIVEMRYGVMALLGIIACLPLALTLMQKKISPLVYPPYHPPEIQKIGNWMSKDELLMSDIPWAIAWYGDRPCVDLSLNVSYEFSAINDFIKPVNGLYLTLNTLNGRLFDCLHSRPGSWQNFTYQSVTMNKLPPPFPLKHAAFGLSSGLFLTDKQRWESQ